MPLVWSQSTEFWQPDLYLPGRRVEDSFLWHIEQPQRNLKYLHHGFPIETTSTATKTTQHSTLHWSPQVIAWGTEGLLSVLWSSSYINGQPIRTRHVEKTLTWNIKRKKTYSKQQKMQGHRNLNYNILTGIKDMWHLKHINEIIV